MSPPPNPTRPPRHARTRKLASAAALAAVATVLAFALRHAPGLRVAADKLDDLLYDSVYHLRTPQDMTSAETLIVAVDNKSLSYTEQFGAWPWRREYWGHVVRFLEKAGARAVVFDLLFTEPSKWADEGDDQVFADAVNEAKMPVILAAWAGDEGKFDPAAPPFAAPRFGAVNVGESAVYRTYAPTVGGLPALALRAVEATDPAAHATAPASPFRMHYYGPSGKPEARRTFQYVSAAHVIGAAMPTETRPPEHFGVPFERFRGKIVLVGTIATGTYDEKGGPLDRTLPGVAIQATAIENLLHGQFVRPVGRGAAWALTALGAFLAAAATVVPRRVTVKLLAAVSAAGVLFAVAAGLFTGQTIRWLPLAAPGVALLLATVGGFAWSYLTEDRMRRQILRQLAGYVSPAVAARVADDPRMLAPEKREMTVMFTDIAGFTNISETLPSAELAAMMNFYLGEMAAVILSQDWTIDKFIGDAVMSFWNAPLDQPDHATAACRAALAIVERERQIQDELRRLCGAPVVTRVGINSGSMTVGDMGSQRKFNFTVLGDAVNLGSRLEGANKLYGSRILLAEATADLVRGRFLTRQLDVLRVPGKQRGVGVYELLAEGGGDDALRRRAAGYEAAFAHYRGRRWDDAAAALDALLAAFPDDAPAAALLDRVARLRADPPPADWDGVFVSKTK